MDARKITALAAMLGWCAFAQAQFSSTITAVSDYDFRGTSVSATQPALQASVDYEFANGLWIGAWASNLDYGADYDGSVELDWYAGYTHEFSQTRSWSTGVTLYTYPDSNDPIEIEPYAEAYVDATLGGFHAAQWYAPDYGGSGASALYTEANYTWSLPWELSLRAHAGYSWGEYWDDDTQGGGGLGDYALGLARDAGHFTLEVKITGTDASGDRKITHGPFTNDARFLVSIATTVPWSPSPKGN